MGLAGAWLFRADLTTLGWHVRFGAGSWLGGITSRNATNPHAAIGRAKTSAKPDTSQPKDNPKLTQAKPQLAPKQPTYLDKALEYCMCTYTRKYRYFYVCAPQVESLHAALQDKNLKRSLFCVGHWKPRAASQHRDDHQIRKLF